MFIPETWLRSGGVKVKMQEPTSRFYSSFLSHAVARTAVLFKGLMISMTTCTPWNSAR